MNSDFLKALLFVLLLDGVFFMAQLGVDSVAADVGTNTSVFNYEGSLINSADAGNYTLDSNIADDIPTGTNTVDSSGNVFTDIYKTLRSWTLNIPLVNAVPRLVYFMGGDLDIAFVVGAIWHLLIIGIMIAWLKGGGG
jgi:hypothetical protein